MSPLTPAAIALLLTAGAAIMTMTNAASAEPRQAAGMLADPTALDRRSGDSRAAPITTDGPGVPVGSARTPRKPDSPVDNSIWAPPLPGYAIMFLLGAAVVTLNLWASKRTDVD